MQSQFKTKMMIPIDSCLPGMILMQSIVDENTGTVILGKGQTLTQNSIKRLQKFNHTQIWISLGGDESSQRVISGERSVWKLDEQTIEKYKSYSQILRAIAQEIKQGEPLSIERLLNVADRMIGEFTDNYQMLACVHLLDQMNSDEYMHSVNVAGTSLVLGKWLGYDDATLREIVITGLLHDVGKLDINPKLMGKSEDNMTHMERVEYRRYPILGYERLVSYNELSINILKGVLSHHERCDGTGYPLCLKEDRINDIAKIVGLADTYDKLRSKYNIFEVIKILQTKMMHKFDVTMLLRFCGSIMNYYIGALVMLNTEEIGEIVFIQSQALHRPIIKIRGEYINLYEKTHRDIVRVI